jgi:23S rRNA pseudouridine2605 synthase
MDTSSGESRLNKYLALQLGISRREADSYIEQGRVRVNSQVAHLGSRVRPEDTVEVDGHLLGEKQEYIYIAFHKPVGYVSSRRAQGDAPTLYDLLPRKLHMLKTVGRLDKDSSGILLLTNDGDFAYQMTHPKFHKIKIYEIELDQPLQPLHQQMISDFGVQLEDGPSKFLIEKLPDEKTDKITYRVTMSEGRNRQIRRTFRALGYSVTKLHRTHFGSYALGDMPPGSYERVTIA